MIKLIFRFTIFLTLLMGIAFSLHLFTLHFFSFPLFENKVITSYLINYLLTVTIYITLLLLKEKLAESLGYLFFLGSFLKFITFFLLIQPSLKEDGDISRIEFLSFFVPYAISLIFEVTSLVKTLNKEG
jgi:hypothetical protein